MPTSFGNRARQIPKAETPDEPSMDEILASIREIIAEDEAADGKRNERALYTHPTDASNANTAKAAMSESPPTSVALADSTPQASAANQELSATLRNIEERAARIRTDLGMSNQTAAAATSEKTVAAMPDTRLKTEKLADTHRSSSRFIDPVPIPRQPEPPRESAPPAASLAAPAAPVQRAPQPAALPRAQAVPPKPAEAPAYKAPPAPKFTPKPQSPSPAAAELEVGSTFDQIAANLLAEKSDDLEAMLGDMMRPIVRKWLGENLPTLVERLVREEIEKVSRGRK